MNEVEPVLTPIKAIRAKCPDCCCGQVKEVRICHIQSCALWPYRMGHRPKVHGEGIAEQSVTSEGSNPRREAIGCAVGGTVATTRR